MFGFGITLKICYLHLIEGGIWYLKYKFPFLHFFLDKNSCNLWSLLQTIKYFKFRFQLFHLWNNCTDLTFIKVSDVVNPFFFFWELRAEPTILFSNHILLYDYWAATLVLISCRHALNLCGLQSLLILIREISVIVCSDYVSIGQSSVMLLGFLKDVRTTKMIVSNRNDAF